ILFVCPLMEQAACFGTLHHKFRYARAAYFGGQSECAKPPVSDVLEPVGKGVILQRSLPV
ncbi:hypothetical protein, partial [Neisseria dumasiana]|uniref:hypothetical protein n=1 Tax=Neisseria dumasiana TaxID=1931275 RepID=UPI001C0C8D84